MSLDPQSLQKLLIEMDNQLNKAQAELSVCNVQLDRVNTNVKIVDATTAKLSKLAAPGESVWKGVGRAFVQMESQDYLKSIADDKKGFLETKKLLDTKKNYLETTLEKTIHNMTEITKR